MTKRKRAAVSLASHTLLAVGFLLAQRVYFSSSWGRWHPSGMPVFTSPLNHILA
jgi:hypothetical protein